MFSYANGLISQIGLVEAAAITALKPAEFGSAGENWSQEGWLVRVNWQPLKQPLVPQKFFELLQPLLPERYSPISTTTGRGNQGIYLAGLSDSLGGLLLQLIEQHSDPAVRVHLVVLAEESAYAAALLDDMPRLREVPSSTERDALTKARLGQGLFRRRVSELEPACRVTGLARQEFLVASHIKPWRSCDNSERLSGANGLLLSPHVDKLFDRHWISFDTGGELIWHHEAAVGGLALLGHPGGQPDPAFRARAGALYGGPPGSPASLGPGWSARAVRAVRGARTAWSGRRLPRQKALDEGGQGHRRTAQAPAVSAGQTPPALHLQLRINTGDQRDQIAVLGIGGLLRAGQGFRFGLGA